MECPQSSRLLYDATNCHGRGNNDCLEYVERLEHHLSKNGKGSTLPARNKAIGDSQLCADCRNFHTTCQGLSYAKCSASGNNNIHQNKVCKNCYTLDNELKNLLKNKHRTEQLEDGLLTLKASGKLDFRDGMSISDVPTANKERIDYASGPNSIDKYCPRRIDSCFTSDHHSNSVGGSIVPMRESNAKENEFVSNWLHQLPLDQNVSHKRFIMMLHRTSTENGYSKSHQPNMLTFLMNAMYITTFALCTFAVTLRNVIFGTGLVYVINCFFGEGRQADTSPLEGIEKEGIPGVKHMIFLTNALTDLNSNHNVTILVSDVVEIGQSYINVIYFLLEFHKPKQVHILVRLVREESVSVSVHEWLTHLLSMKNLDGTPAGTTIISSLLANYFIITIFIINIIHHHIALLSEAIGNLHKVLLRQKDGVDPSIPKRFRSHHKFPDEEKFNFHAGSVPFQTFSIPTLLSCPIFENADDLNLAQAVQDDADDSSSLTTVGILKQRLDTIFNNYTATAEKRKRDEESVVPDQKFYVVYYQEKGHKRVKQKLACVNGTSTLLPGFYSKLWVKDTALATGGKYVIKYPKLH